MFVKVQIEDCSPERESVYYPKVENNWSASGRRFGEANKTSLLSCLFQTGLALHVLMKGVLCWEKQSKQQSFHQMIP